jgi:hypothetical protein
VRAVLPVSDLFLVLNVLLLVVLLLVQRRTLHRYFNQWWTSWCEHHPRRWKPQSPPRLSTLPSWSRSPAHALQA